jgi:hypothetical protein
MHPHTQTLTLYAAKIELLIFPPLVLPELMAIPTFWLLPSLSHCLYPNRQNKKIKNPIVLCSVQTLG